MTDIQYRQIRIIITVAIALVASFFAWKFLEQGYEVIGRYSCDDKAIIVNEGDTLFSIARENCVGSIERAVDDIYSFYGANIRPSQQIYLPHANGCPIVLGEGNRLDDC